MWPKGGPVSFGARDRTRLADQPVLTVLTIGTPGARRQIPRAGCALRQF
jgi:hypothetical protein